MDRKADITYEELIVRRGIQRDCPLFYLVADVGHVDLLGRLIAKIRIACTHVRTHVSSFLHSGLSTPNPVSSVELNEK